MVSIMPWRIYFWEGTSTDLEITGVKWWTVDMKNDLGNLLYLSLCCIKLAILRQWIDMNLITAHLYAVYWHILCTG